MDDALGDLVRMEWPVLMAEHGLRLVREDDLGVTLRSELLEITVTRGRGELSVSAFLLSSGSTDDAWRYEGMV